VAEPALRSPAPERKGVRISTTLDLPLPLDRHAIDGYGLGGRHGCIIDLSDITLRAGAIATGLIWSAPMGAQKQAVLDIASGHVERPEYPLPEWVSDTLDYPG
jgi:hypothetical protein